MNIPRILIFGKNGQVGWELRRTLAPLGNVISFDYPEVDFTSPESLVRCVDEARPQIIINAAAYTAVDKAEKEPERCRQINAAAPGVIAEQAKKRGALLVHYSTDYVFDGGKGAPYVETDAPSPLGVYGQTKLAGDLAVQQVDGAHLIFRLCWVYGARGQNFMLTMMRLARERETLRVVNDQFGCPTPCRLIAETTAAALARCLSHSPPQEGSGVFLNNDCDQYKGLYHLCCSTSTTWHGFAKAIIEHMPASGIKCTQVEPITTDQYPTPARRPAASVMSCEKLQRVFGFQLPGWLESMELVMGDMPECRA